MKVSVSIQKSHVICAAHRLMNHPGKCSRLHGHNYKITYYLSADHMVNGMIMDFGEVKDLIIKTVDTTMDHKIILHEEDPLTTAFASDEMFLLKAPPTAENIAIGIVAAVQSLLDQEYNTPERNILLARVDVEETPGAVASAFLIGD